MKPYLKIQKHEALGNYLPENDFKSCSTVNLRKKKIQILNAWKSTRAEQVLSKKFKN